MAAQLNIHSIVGSGSILGNVNGNVIVNMLNEMHGLNRNNSSNNTSAGNKTKNSSKKPGNYEQNSSILLLFLLLLFFCQFKRVILNSLLFLLGLKFEF